MAKPAKYSHDRNTAKDAKRQNLSKAKKNIKRNRDARPPRRGNWIDLAYADVDDIDQAALSERIMPLNERDRRKSVEKVMYEEVAPGKPALPESSDLKGARGRVVEVSCEDVRLLAELNTPAQATAWGVALPR